MDRFSRGLLILTGAMLLLALVLLLDIVPFLRGGFGWQWPYEPATWNHVLPLVSVLLIYVAGAFWLIRRASRDWPLLIWSFMGVVVLSLAGLWLRSDDVLYELFVRTASGVTTGQHFAGVEIDWSDPGWVNWPQTVEPFVGRSGHIVLSGPALPLWYGLLNTLLAQFPAVADPLQQALIPLQCRNYDLLAYTPAEWASAWFGIFMPVWAALAVWPLYRVARRLIGLPGARLAVSWWPLVPALILFTPTWNTVYPLAALVAFWFLLKGLHGRAGWLIGSGLLSGLLLFANFSMLPLLGLLGFYTLLHDLWLERRRWYRPVIVGLWFVVGLVIPWLVFGCVSGLTPLDLFNHAMANHLFQDRPYLPWLWLHFWEWALLSGLPLAALWLWFTIRRPTPQTPGALLAVALLLTMLVLLLSGTARGETGRVWLFFAPFVLICASAAVGDRSPGRSWLVLSAGQAVLLLAVGATWMLINAPNMSPPPLSPGPTVAERPQDVRVADAFRLTGWDARVMENNRLQLRLNWQVSRQMTTPYWFAALLVAPDGSLPLDSVVWQALDTEYPTSCWKPGEVVGDRVELPLPADAPAGDWWISLSVFGDKQHPEIRLPVTLADGTEDDQIGLGPVTVE